MFDAAGCEASLERWLGELEPGLYSGEDALRLLEVLSRITRLAGAAETLLAARVAETEVWREHSTDRSAAHWLARRCGIPLAQAKAKLDTAERLGALPATAAAFREGRLSDDQAREVVAGALADPTAEARLLATAADDSLVALRDESRRAQAVDDEEGRQQRIHQRRALRVRVESDGTWCLTFRGTVYAGARIMAALHPYREAAFKAARTEGRRESLAAYAADGLVAMADTITAFAERNDTSTEGPRPPRSNVKIIIRVDATALRRGAVEAGEVCDIPGLGPVPVSTAKELLGEAALAVVVTDGVDIVNVTHLKRRTTAHQRTALEFWGIRCDHKGCDSTDFVDVHHVYQWARHNRTRLDELRTPCRSHHRQEHRGRQPTPDQLRPRSTPGTPKDNPLPLTA